MQTRSGALGDRVRAVGILHEIERFAQFHQSVDEPFRSLKMDVVVARPVHDEKFAAQTGGAAYIPKSVGELDVAFAQISADLAQQYILSYYPAPDKRDGRYHVIVVSVKARPNARVRARKGFLVKNRDRV